MGTRQGELHNSAEETLGHCLFRIVSVDVFHRFPLQERFVLRVRQILMILSALGFGAVPAAGDWLLGLSYYQQGKYRRAVNELLTRSKRILRMLWPIESWVSAITIYRTMAKRKRF